MRTLDEIRAEIADMSGVPPDLSTPPPDPSRRDHPTGSPARRKLPIGIQTLRTIRTDGHYYVDKTPHVARLVGSGSRYFLSRPRRFGKSLLVDTLKSLFEAQEDLFRGLAIHDSWDWSLRHPVLKLDFAGGDFSTPARLEAWVIAQLEDQAYAAGIDPPAGHAPERLQRTIRALREAGGGSQVVVLVDEYDKPILDVLASPDAARSSRDFLRGLYGTLKTCDEHLRLVLLTGVSKFSKVNLFSGLNNLDDITLDPRFATICGYTDAELDQVFAPELDGLDRDAIRKWYNGYGWRGEPVYNPFDILLLLKNREFGAYWFETGTPTFLLELLSRRGVNSFDLDSMVADDALLSTFDVDRIEPEALLFQAGYLTVRDHEHLPGHRLYRLRYPNLEVRHSLHRSLLNYLCDRGIRPTRWLSLTQALRAGDMAALEAELRALFAGIPYQWHTRNELARYEGYYASVFYSFLVGSELDVRVEDSSAAGRLDVAVVLDEAAYVFELKVAERATPGAALEQLRRRAYADKHRRPGRPVHLVGIHFSEESRNIVEIEMETA